MLGRDSALYEKTRAGVPLTSVKTCLSTKLMSVVFGSSDDVIFESPHVLRLSYRCPQKQNQRGNNEKGEHPVLVSEALECTKTVLTLVEGQRQPER